MIGHNAQNDQRQSEYNWKNPDQNYHCMKAYNLWDHYQQKKNPIFGLHFIKSSKTVSYAHVYSQNTIISLKNVQF